MADVFPSYLNVGTQQAGWLGGELQQKPDVKGYMDASIKNQGEQFNPYFNAAGGQVSGLMSSIGGAMAFGEGMAEEIAHYRDMTFKQAETEIGGVPTYTGVSSLRKQVGAIDPETAGKGMIGQGVMKGAALGASIGSFFPGLGTAIGAGVGAVAGGVTGIFGKKATKKRAEEAEVRGQETFIESQEAYSEDVEEYYEDIDVTRAEQQAERNYRQRMYGTNITDPFATLT